MSAKGLEIEKKAWFPVMVWMLRIIVGAVFVMSGLVKALDLWGFVFKIEEYLAVWGISQPRSIAVMGALLISSYEFVFGFLLAMGCYKRMAVWALTATMTVWLPLTFYIWIAHPVADCGCFGDFWILSNFLTFVKNLVLTAMLIMLICYNSKVKAGMYKPAVQWIVGALFTLYVVIVALYGYNVQPMVDFRPYPPGVRLIETEETADECDGEDDYNSISFLYEKDGVTKEFSLDALPDSTWTFLERIEGETSSNSGAAGSAFAIYDQDGEDVTEDAISAAGRELLIVIPESNRFDISYSSFLNDLYQWAGENDVTMICLIGNDSGGIEQWQDLSMASYPIYSVEDTKLKELSRGTMALVVLDNGVITRKFTLSSVGGDALDSGPVGADFIERISPQPEWWLKVLTFGIGALLLLIFLFQGAILAVSSRIRRKYQKKEVNLQSETEKSYTDKISDDNNNT